MKSKLKCIFTQMGDSLENTYVELEHNFCILVHLTIGPEDQEGGNDYSFSLCTPTWLDHNGQNQGPIWGRHLLIVNRFDPKEITDAIEKIIAQCGRDGWDETAVVLSRFFAWEFEDYQP